MENDNYCILVYDKQTYFKNFFIEGECIQDGLEGLKSVNLPSDCIFSYFKFKVRDTVTVYFIVHNFDTDIQNNILDENMVVRDKFYNNCLPNEVKDKQIIIAGHWGKQTEEEYINNIIKPANFRKDNKKRNITISYYGTQLKNCKWVPSGNQVAYDKKILELAGISISKSETKSQLINLLLPLAIDIQGLHDLKKEIKEDNIGNLDENHKWVQYFEEVKESVESQKNEFLKTWEKYKTHNAFKTLGDINSGLPIKLLGEINQNDYQDFFDSDFIKHDNSEFLPKWLETVTEKL